MFKTGLIHQRVKLLSSEVGQNVHSVLEDRVRSLLEGVCGRDGYVRPGSVELVHAGPGVLTRGDMGRRYEYNLKLKAEICNPSKGLRVLAVVRSINKFGVLAEGGYFNYDGAMVPVIEIIIVRDAVNSKHEVEFDGISVGDEVGVEILGRRYELRDKRISALGRLVLDVKVGEVTDGIVLDTQDDESGEDKVELDETDDEVLVESDVEEEVATEMDEDEEDMEDMEDGVSAGRLDGEDESEE